MAETVKVGDQAPEFTLKNQDGKEVTLSSLRGQEVVLCFYPFDWSPVCSTENQCITRDLEKFAVKGAKVLGISCDSWFCHKAWQDALGLKHELLSDFRRDAVKKYGLHFEDLNCAQRATVVVDPDGKVKMVKVQPSLKDARSNEEILAAL